MALNSLLCANNPLRVTLLTHLPPPWAMVYSCLRDPKFGRFDTIPACDGHTHTTACTTLA